MLMSLGHVTCHFLVVAVSAAFALSIPAVVSALARGYLRFWTVIERNEANLVAVEVVIAAALILFLNGLRRDWKDRRLSRTARAAGLFLMSPGGGLVARWNAARLERDHAAPVLPLAPAGHADTGIRPETDELVCQDDAGGVRRVAFFAGADAEAEPQPLAPPLRVLTSRRSPPIL